MLYLDRLESVVRQVPKNKISLLCPFDKIFFCSALNVAPLVPKSLFCMLIEQCLLPTQTLLIQLSAQLTQESTVIKLLFCDYLAMHTHTHRGNVAVEVI